MLVLSAFQLVSSIIFTVKHSPGAKIADILPPLFFIVVVWVGGGGEEELFTNSTYYHDYLVCMILSKRAMLQTVILLYLSFY